MTIRVIACALMLSAPALSSGQTAEQTTPQSQHEHSTEEDRATLFPAHEASGTAWVPDDTPMYGYHRTWGTWETMLHGNAFGQFLYEPGEIHRTGGFAARQVSSVN